MSDLHALVSAELAAPIRREVVELAEALAAGARRLPVAVLFYGSALRTGDLDGILDFYVILDDTSDWSHGRLAARANRWLPPNVEYHEAATGDGRVLRAKVAILSLEQARARVRAGSLDTTVWARFSQPVGLAFARDDAAARLAGEVVAEAVASAVFWSIALGPDAGRPEDFWRALFRRTYASELRVETTARSDEIVDRAPERYRAMFLAACAAKAIDLEAAGSECGVRPKRSRTDGERRWKRRARLAKPLNVARLAKAAFTFKNGADYIAWKVQRHTGEAIAPTETQRRWPLLLVGPLLWRLIRRRRASG